MTRGMNWEDAWIRIQNAFREVAKEVQQSFPDSTWTSDYHSTEVFPFRAYATFTRADKRIDLSVDCKLVDESVSISTDLATENGMVIAELPTIRLLLKDDGSSLAAQVVAQLAPVLDFIVTQVNSITNFLCSQET